MEESQTESSARLASIRGPHISHRKRYLALGIAKKNFEIDTCLLISVKLRAFR